MNKLSKIILFLLVILFMIKFFSIGNTKIATGGAKHIITPTVAPTLTPTPTSTPEIMDYFIGKISNYSEKGCLGCSANLTMANGEKLDDTKPTIAYNHLPLGTIVIVKNLDNNKSIQAVVTDRGGFEKYGRIADLTPVVTNAIEAVTDKSLIQIIKL